MSPNRAIFPIGYKKVVDKRDLIIRPPYPMILTFEKSADLVQLNSVTSDFCNTDAIGAIIVRTRERFMALERRI